MPTTKSTAGCSRPKASMDGTCASPAKAPSMCWWACSPGTKSGMPTTSTCLKRATSSTTMCTGGRRYRLTCKKPHPCARHTCGPRKKCKPVLGKRALLTRWPMPRECTRWTFASNTCKTRVKSRWSRWQPSAWAGPTAKRARPRAMCPPAGAWPCTQATARMRRWPARSR